MGSEFAWDRSLHRIGVYMDLEFVCIGLELHGLRVCIGLERHGLRR